MKSLRQSLQNPSPDSLVCVVDDDELIRRSLSRLFRAVGVPVETFASAEDYLDRDEHEGPSCLVLDVQMPGLDGLRLQKRLADREQQIVFVSGHADVPKCAQAMKAGAVDFLTKPVDEDALLETVSRALARSVGTRRAAGDKKAARERLEALTARELEVMQHVIAGMLNKQIAEALGAAEKTIKIHRGRVMEKMGVTSVADLVRLAQAAGVSPAAAVGLP